METLHIQRMLDSETIPELKPLLGRNVEIIVRDLSTPLKNELLDFKPGTGDWAAFQQAADTLRKTYDFDAVRIQDECDRQDAASF